MIGSLCECAHDCSPARSVIVVSRRCHPGSFTPRVDWFLQGSRSNGIAYLPQLPGSDNQVPGYGLVNARITYTANEGDWAVALAAENLLDKFYWYQLAPYRSNNNAIGNPITDNRTGTPARGREVTLTFRKNFN